MTLLPFSLQFFNDLYRISSLLSANLAVRFRLSDLSQLPKNGTLHSRRAGVLLSVLDPISLLMSERFVT